MVARLGAKKRLKSIFFFEIVSSLHFTSLFRGAVFKKFQENIDFRLNKQWHYWHFLNCTFLMDFWAWWDGALWQRFHIFFKRCQKPEKMQFVQKKSPIVADSIIVSCTNYFLHLQSWFGLVFCEIRIRSQKLPFFGQKGNRTFAFWLF